MLVWLSSLSALQWYLVATPFGLVLLFYAGMRSESAPDGWHPLWLPVAILSAVAFGPGALIGAVALVMLLFGF